MNIDSHGNPKAGMRAVYEQLRAAALRLVLNIRVYFSFAFAAAALAWTQYYRSNSDLSRSIRGLILGFILFVLLGCCFDKTDQSEAEHAPLSVRLLGAFRNTVSGMQVTLWIAIMMMLVVRQSPLFHELEQSGYAWFLSAAAEKARRNPNDVIVIDTSAIPTVEPDNYQDHEVHVTDRAVLRATIDAILQGQPAAVGVDIGFSRSPHGGFYVDDDDKFYEHFLPTTDRRFPMPHAARVFLGVDNYFLGDNKLWLGSDSYQDLASFTVVPSDGVHLFADVSLPHKPALPGLSASLATEFIKSRKSRNSSVDNSGHEFDDLSARQPLGCDLFESDAFYADSRFNDSLQFNGREYLVDQSYLDYVRDSVMSLEEIGITDTITNRIRSGEDVSHEIRLSEACRKRLAGKVVLLGDVEKATATDLSSTNERDNTLIPGVLLHACGVETLINDPLFEPQPHLRPWADVIVAFGSLLFLNIILSLTTRLSEKRLESALRLGLFLIAVIVITTARQNVGTTRMVWSEALVILLAVAMHPYIEDLGVWLKREEKRDEKPGTDEPETPAPALAAPAPREQISASQDLGIAEGTDKQNAVEQVSSPKASNAAIPLSIPIGENNAALED